MCVGTRPPRTAGQPLNPCGPAKQAPAGSRKDSASSSRRLAGCRRHEHGPWVTRRQEPPARPLDQGPAHLAIPRAKAALSPQGGAGEVEFLDHMATVVGHIHSRRPHGQAQLQRGRGHGRRIGTGRGCCRSQCQAMQDLRLPTAVGRAEACRLQKVAIGINRQQSKHELKFAIKAQHLQSDVRTRGRCAPQLDRLYLQARIHGRHTQADPTCTDCRTTCVAIYHGVEGCVHSPMRHES